MNSVRADVDIYSRRRASIVERLESGLHPHARWRDPREASSSSGAAVDGTPLAHTLAGACVWLRQHRMGRLDVSADLLWCIVVPERSQAERELVEHALSRAWQDMHADVATLARTMSGLSRIDHASAVMVARVVTGIDRPAKIGLHWQTWRKMQESGERMLWGLADKASRRAVIALR